LIITEKPNLFYECFLCGRKFQFGQYVYERPIHSGLGGSAFALPPVRLLQARRLYVAPEG